ncbi:hypothetical protein C3Y87_19635 [Carbonactinospora thermoautotrophica]|uniref:Membrane-flanked domain protein n=1 Tax=Carbonactinospora thermoautotrophica TaxID=1469144 RepID=A0A132MJE5_9ACTN|nr:PH domain-containing protein [Carbonactinospora thermoautotrophica]KWW97948.1 hypothetical protein TH66_21525 [Carbonactinospora thermoautotrophica]KWX03163.1 Membrane-flanked domain protein [Carbonactinospora thermoautotrophica]KWX06998.1 hypothetical protein TR74_20270 [Carbonactinospora thermoautotrophica]MCX9193560.1 hypothetical protein [Carbonactinospora thermoautotrophica]
MDANLTPEERAIRRYLTSDERLVAATRRHMAILLKPAFATIGGLFLVFFLDAWLPEDLPYLRDLLVLGWFVLFGWLVWQIIEWYYDRFIITNRRLILTYGIINRKVAMMPLVKVTDMRYDRPILGRILGYGVFVMESAGQDQALSTVDYVPDPDILYLEICDLLFGKR